MILLALSCAGGPSPAEPEPAPSATAFFQPLTEGSPIRLAAGADPRRIAVDLPEPTTLWDAHGDLAILRADTDPTRGMLLSLSDGTLRSYPGRPRAVAWEAGWLSTHPPALVSLSDGQVQRPAVETPAGPAELVVLMLGDADVHVLARSEDGRMWHGPWARPSEAAVSVAGVLPQLPRGQGWDSRGRPEVWVSDGVPVGTSDGPCVRWRLDTPEPRCTAVEDTDPTAHRVSLSGGWSVADAWGAPVSLYRDSQPVPWRLEPECDWTLEATLTDPPRVLASCQPSRDTPTRERRLWSPDHAHAWQRDLPPSDRGMFRTRALDAPVIFEAIPGTQPPLAVRWINLATVSGWESAPLVPLRGDSQDVPVLTRDPWTGSLVLLDLEAGVQHALSNAGEDCPVDLIEQHRAGHWVVLSCRQQVSPDRLEFQQLYAQIVDLDGRRSWRLAGMVEALLAGGTVLISDRTLDTAEGSVPFAVLEVWDLDGEPDSLQNP